MSTISPFRRSVTGPSVDATRTPRPATSTAERASSDAPLPALQGPELPPRLDGWTQAWRERLSSALDGWTLPTPTAPAGARGTGFSPGDPNLVPTAERGDRSAVQEGLLRELLSSNRPTPAGQTPVAYFLAGGIGVGKVAFAKRFYETGVVPADVVQADPDVLHARIPEYQALVDAGERTAATVVHEESSAIAREAFRRALANRQSVLYNTMLSRDDAYERLERARQAGFRVAVLGLVSPLDIAVARVRASGTEIPLEEISASHRGFEERIAQISQRSDAFLLVENTGEAARLLAAGSAGHTQVLDAEGFARVRAPAPTTDWF